MVVSNLSYLLDFLDAWALGKASTKLSQVEWHA
jgi:hypothetical protein